MPLLSATLHQIQQWDDMTDRWHGTNETRIPLFYRDERGRPDRRSSRSSRLGICPQERCGPTSQPRPVPNRVSLSNLRPACSWGPALWVLSWTTRRSRGPFHRDSTVGAVSLHVAAALVAQVFLGTQLRCFPVG